MASIKEISIVLVGNWDTKIFTPSWMIGELLTLSENEELNMGFNNNNLQLLYKYKNVHFIPTERVFEIKLVEISEETISIANKAVLKLITKLPYTPNLLVGFNYSVIDDFSVTNVSVPKFSTSYALNEIHFFKEEQNFVLNVILNCKDKSSVNYNFHYSNLNFITENVVEEHLAYLEKSWEQI
jgi:hypothetical protein